MQKYDEKYLLENPRVGKGPRIYIALEPTFAFRLWTALALMSMEALNMGACDASAPQHQDLVVLLNLKTKKTDIYYLPASKISVFMADLHSPAWFLSEVKTIFKWGACTNANLVLDVHSLLQLDCSQIGRNTSTRASGEFSLLQESSRSLCMKYFCAFFYPYLIEFCSHRYFHKQPGKQSLDETSNEQRTHTNVHKGSL